MALAAALWASLPHGDTALDLLETIAPFAFTEPMNTGGTLTGVPLHAGSEASSWTQASFRLGVSDLTDPATGGRPLFYPDLSAIGALHVKAAGIELHSGAPGTLLTLTPKAGGTVWTREVSAAWSPPGLQSEGFEDRPPVARLHSLGRVEATGGGPLSPRARLFAAVAGTWSSHTERMEPFTLPGNVVSFAAHPTFELGGEKRAGAMAWIQQTRTAFAARALLRDREASTEQWYGGVTANWAGGVRRVVEVSGAYARTRLTPDVAADAPLGTVERLTDDPIESLVASAGGSRSRQSIAATITTGSRTRLQGGVSLTGAGMQASPFGAGLIGETIDGVPVRAWDYGLAGEPRRSQTAFAMFASADRTLVDTLRANAGIRIEHVGASARGAAQKISWTSLEPRLLLHYARGPFSGDMVARRYHPRLALNVLADGDPAAGYGRTYLWTDRNSDGLPQSDERGTLVSVMGPGSPTPGFSAIAPSLDRPYVDELMVAIDLRMSAWSSLRFSGVSRRGAALLARYNTGVPFDAYTVRHEFDPGLDLLGDQDDQMLPIYSRPPSTFGADQYLLKNIDGVNSTYGGLYVAVLFNRLPRWNLLVGATALHSYAPAAFRGYLPSQNDELLIGDSYTDPNSNTFSEGRTLFDRGYGLKVTGTYNAGRRLTFSTAARYADGQNFARLVVVPDLPQGRDVVRAFANGKTKFTYTMTLDLRAQKVFTWQGHDVTLALETYNAIDLHNEVEEVTITGPLWRKGTFAQPPRVIRLGASFAF